MLEKTLESPLDYKEIHPVHPKGNQSWTFTERTDAEAETKRPWCWERLKVGGEGDDWGWDGWMASSVWWTWVWVGSGSWWWTGKPGVLQSMGSQRVRQDWATELNWVSKHLNDIVKVIQLVDGEAEIQINVVWCQTKAHALLFCCLRPMPFGSFYTLRKWLFH